MVWKGEWSLIILRGNTNEVSERKRKEVVVKEEWFLVRDSLSLKYEGRGLIKICIKMGWGGVGEWFWPRIHL